MAYAFDRMPAGPAIADAFDRWDPLRVEDELTKEKRLVRGSTQRPRWAR